MRNKKFERSIEGLRDALLSEMEDLRAGLASPAEAQSYALLARNMIASIEVEITERVRQDAKEERALKRQERERALMLEQPKVLELTYESEEYD